MFLIPIIGIDLAPHSVAVERYTIDYEKATLDIIRYNTQNPISSPNVPDGNTSQERHL